MFRWFDCKWKVLEIDKSLEGKTAGRLAPSPSRKNLGAVSIQEAIIRNGTLVQRFASISINCEHVI